MRGVRQEHFWIGILICAAVVALPHVIRGLGGAAALNRAIRAGDRGKVARLLESNPALVHSSDKRTGATPLHWAALGNHMDIAELLLERGADVNEPDAYGLTSLHKTASFNRPDMARFLLNNGADTGAMGMKYRVFKMNPLHLAAEAGFPEVVAVLLESGADPNARTEGTNSVTSLHISSSKGHYNVSSLLLDFGADVNAKDSTGATPMRWARISGQDKIEKLLRVHGGR